MSPSKENCLKTLSELGDLKAMVIQHLENAEARKLFNAQMMFIGEFLASAAKRLPKEAALARDKLRKRGKVKA